MRSPAVACALIFCLCPLVSYAEDKDSKKSTESRLPEMKLKDENFASSAGLFSIAGGAFSPLSSFKPAGDFAAPSRTFKPSGNFQPSYGAFTVQSGDFKPQGQFTSSGFKLDGDTFSSSGFLTRK